MALAARIEIEKEQELRRIGHAELQAAIDVKNLDQISENIRSGKEQLTSHSDVMSAMGGLIYL
ncbi:MAG: hypothetical protein LBN12_04920 [Clostridiales Family XIII bacterium]|jgi:hypothetical protein|nr:hypothetical protein [Clostridiales Family XIII bacterium]